MNLSMQGWRRGAARKAAWLGGLLTLALGQAHAALSCRA